MSDDIDELVEKIRPTDAPPADERDDAEFMEGFARKFRGGERPIATALADVIPPEFPLIGLLAERIGPDRQPPREVDVREFREIEWTVRQVDKLIADLRAWRDHLEHEAERREREDSR